MPCHRTRYWEQAGLKNNLCMLPFTGQNPSGIALLWERSWVALPEPCLENVGKTNKREKNQSWTNKNASVHAVFSGGSATCWLSTSSYLRFPQPLVINTSPVCQSVCLPFLVARICFTVCLHYPPGQFILLGCSFIPSALRRGSGPADTAEDPGDLWYSILIPQV